MSKSVCVVFLVCLLLICICCGSMASSVYKQRRQVVQPTWLMRPDLIPSIKAPEVKVTRQNLQETAAIRDSIQKAVNDGTYVVAASPQQFHVALGTTGGIGTMLPLTVLPSFANRNATWWNSGWFFG